MLHFITFALIFAVMMFIWTFVYLNRSRDRINQSFLYFLSVMIVWMVLSVSNTYNDTTTFGLILKTVYWYSMMSMSLFFLLFVYRFIKKRPDALFTVIVVVNSLTIVSRYFFPLDYTDPTFWRLSIPVVAPVMSGIFSLPALYALFLIIRQFLIVKNKRVRSQLKIIFWGIGFACMVSVLSEFVLPAVFHVNTGLSLMYFAFLIFVVCIFISIMKYRLLNIQTDYVYQKLFQNSSDGIVIVNKNHRIININNLAKQMLKDENLDSGDKITKYLKEYVFETDYKLQEFIIQAQGQETYLTITQYPIDTEDADSAKLLIINDITARMQDFQREKDLLLEKSSIDQLTGLYNKRYFVDKYYGDGPGAMDVKLSLLFIDVDDFKSINDLHGHLFGDKVLKSLAESIKCNVRSDTEIIRFGGDEFIVVLENTKLEDAYLVAERIRNCAGRIDFSVGGGPEIKITLSIGLIEGSAPINDLIVKADMAMYSSKSRGKNKTTIFTENNTEHSFHMKV